MRCRCKKCYHNDDGWCMFGSSNELNETGQCELMDLDPNYVDDHADDTSDENDGFYVGQVVSKDQICDSAEWVIDSVCGNADYYSVTYVTTDNTLTVTFADCAETAVIYLNR